MRAWFDGIDWELTSQVATSIGVPLAVISALIALLAYRSQVVLAADTHLHAIFREFLKERMTAQDIADDRFTTFRLYTLEEMLDWVSEQERDLFTWGLLRPWAWPRRWGELKSWRATIESHLSEARDDRAQRAKDIAALNARIKSRGAAYGPRFARFVAAAARKAAANAPAPPPPPPPPPAAKPAAGPAA